MKLYNRQSLSDFINSDQFGTLMNIPISRQRAISQINNPRADDSDVLLVVQFDKDRMIGYLGVLPDYVFNGIERLKAGWLSCFWVDGSYRTKSVAAGLFLQVMESWDQRIMITNFVPALSPLYVKTGLFNSGLIKKGCRAYMRSNLADILPPKAAWLKRLKPAFRNLDILFNFIADIRFFFSSAYTDSTIHWNYLNNANDPSEALIDKFIENTWNRRGWDELEWILKYPWIIESPVPDYDSKRYYFSSVSARFSYRIIRISDNKGTTAAWVMICIRDNAMTVPYVFSDNAYFESIARILIDIMIDLKISMITAFHEQLAEAIRKFNMPFLFKKTISKPYLISKKLDFINDLNFQDGDGDCAFY